MSEKNFFYLFCYLRPHWYIMYRVAQKLYPSHRLQRAQTGKKQKNLFRRPQTQIPYRRTLTFPQLRTRILLAVKQSDFCRLMTPKNKEQQGMDSNSQKWNLWQKHKQDLFRRSCDRTPVLIPTASSKSHLAAVNLTWKKNTLLVKDAFKLAAVSMPNRKRVLLIIFFCPSNSPNFQIPPPCQFYQVGGCPTWTLFDSFPMKPQKKTKRQKHVCLF